MLRPPSVATSTANKRGPDSGRIEVADIMQDHNSQTPKRTGLATIDSIVISRSSFPACNNPLTRSNEGGDGNGGGNDGGIRGVAA